MGNFKFLRHIALLATVLSFGTMVAIAQSASVVQVLYPNGSSNLDLSYRSNATELRKLDLIYTSLLDSIKQGHYKMSIIGYGSENQSDEQYRSLGAQRAQALKNYLITKLGAAESYFRPSAPSGRASRFDVAYLSFTSPNAKAVEIIFIYPDGQNKPPKVIARTVPNNDGEVASKTTPSEKPLIFTPQKDRVPVYEVQNWHFDKPATITPPSSTAPHLTETPRAQALVVPPTDEYLDKISGQKPKLLEDPIINEPNRMLYETPTTGRKASTWGERAKSTKKVATANDLNTPHRNDAVKMHNSGREIVMPLISFNTNLLYWAALNYNLELEIFLSKGVSLAIDGQYAHAEWGDGNKKYYISGVSPELRFWLNREGRFIGHALGIYLQAGQYDLKFGEIGHQGDYLGAGISYNYTLPIGYRTAFRFGLAVGYARVIGKTYHSQNLPYYTYIENETRNYIGPTKANISFVWRIGTKRGGWR